jgi:hypothetical protein
MADGGDRLAGGEDERSGSGVDDAIAGRLAGTPTRAGTFELRVARSTRSAHR